MSRWSPTLLRQVLLPITLVVTAGYFLAPAGLVEDLLWQLIVLGALAATAYGVRHYRPDQRQPWVLLQVALFCFAVGGALGTSTFADLTTESIARDLGDVGYLVGYTITGAFGLALLRRRTPQRDFDGVIDSTILTLALATIMWELAFRPAAIDQEAAGLQSLLFVLYPLVPAWVTAMAFRLVFAGGWRLPAVRWCLVGAVAGLGGNVAMVLVESSGTYGGASEGHLLWVLALASIVMAALHPSMRQLTERAEPTESELPAAQVLVLGVALLAAPIALISNPANGGGGGGFRLPLVTSMVLTLLVVWRLLRLIAQRERAREELRKQALEDPLTGLPNRWALMKHLSTACDRAAEQGPVAVLFIDVDGFKEINDTYGHEAGDQVLKAVSNRFRRALRDQDMLARFAGDEFVAVLEGWDAPAVKAVAIRLEQATSDPFVINGVTVEVSASVGVAVDDSNTPVPDDLLRSADQTMYEAKAHRSGVRMTDRVGQTTLDA